VAFAATAIVHALALLLGEPVDLSWTAPAQCPDQIEVLQRAARLLGRPAETQDGERLSVEGVVTQTDAGFHLELRSQMAAGVTERSMADADCQVLADVAAVVIAVAIDPLAALNEAPPREQEPKPAPEAPPEPEDGDDKAPKQTPTGPQGLLRASGLVGVGALPRVGAGLELAGGVAIKRLRVEAFGTYWFAREQRFDADPQLGGRLWLWSAGARACAVPDVGAVSFPICGGVEGGLMHGRGIGVENPKVNRQAWVALAVQPSLAWHPIRHFGLLLGVELLVPVVRPGFGVDYLGQLHSAGPVAGRGKLGVEVRFP
jgi:hypothetical protein